MQQLIDRLRELTAAKFATAPAGAPEAEYTVGKEKVLVNKLGELYYARRANEPEIYVLDAKAVSEIKDLAAAAKEAAAPAAAAKK